MKKLHRTIVVSLVALVAVISLVAARAEHAAKGPRNGTVLIIRHAEKPPKGDPGTGLTAAGIDRAEKYVRYFQPFHDGAMTRTIDAIFAARDSAESIRPRMTVEPLAAAARVPLHTEITNKDSGQLVTALGSGDFDGQTVLVCWHRGEIPDLLAYYGIHPKALLGRDGWPENVFGWVVVLHFGPHGGLTSARVVNQALEPEDREPIVTGKL